MSFLVYRIFYISVSLRPQTAKRQPTQVTVVSADVADLQRGRHLSHAGSNLAVFDLFDSGKQVNDVNRYRSERPAPCLKNPTRTHKLP